MQPAPTLSFLPRPIPARPARRRGRVAVATIPAERERHLAVAYLRLVARQSLASIAKSFSISVRTVHLWIGRALGYDHPQAAALRGLARR